jgi:hypothetical protein
VSPHAPSPEELERERARVDGLFRAGWILERPDQPQGSARQRLPFIDDIRDDFEVIIDGDGEGDGARQCVAVLFSHQSFPGVRFGHRFTPGDPHAPIWLKEAIETGMLRRLMQTRPASNDAGIVWTTWGHAATADR